MPEAGSKPLYTVYSFEFSCLLVGGNEQVVELYELLCSITPETCIYYNFYKNIILYQPCVTTCVILEFLTQTEERKKIKLENVKGRNVRGHLCHFGISDANRKTIKK